MLILKKKEISKLIKEIDLNYIFEVPAPLLDINRMIFNNNLTLDEVRQWIKSQENNMLVLYYTNQRNKLLEKEHFSYFKILIEIKDNNLKNKIIDYKNSMEQVFGEQYIEKIYSKNQRTFLSFRLSINSSHERFNQTLFENLFNVTIPVLQQLFE